MSAYPVTDTRYGEVLAARGVPREQWRNYQKWVRFSRHFCQTYRHRPADSTSLPWFIGKLASKGQTAAQRAQAQCAVEYDSVFLSPQVPSLRDDDAVAPRAPKDGEDSLAARKQESVIGPSPRREEPAHVLVQANGASEQTNAAWREVEAKLKDAILLRPYSPKTLQAYAGWMRKFQGFMVKTHPAELTGAEAKRFLAIWQSGDRFQLRRKTRRSTPCCFGSDMCSHRNSGIFRIRHGQSEARLSPPCVRGRKWNGLWLSCTSPMHDWR